MFLHSDQTKGPTQNKNFLETTEVLPLGEKTDTTHFFKYEGDGDSIICHPRLLLIKCANKNSPEKLETTEHNRTRNIYRKVVSPQNVPFVYFHFANFI